MPLTHFSMTKHFELTNECQDRTNNTQITVTEAFPTCATDIERKFDYGTIGIRLENPPTLKSQRVTLEFLCNAKQCPLMKYLIQLFVKGWTENLHEGQWVNVFVRHDMHEER